MASDIGYHTRLWGNGSKVEGGCFGGAFDLATVNRLVKAHFTVTVKPSGHAVFVDRKGREVSLYVRVDPETTDAGRAVLVYYRKVEELTAKKEEEKREHIQDLVDSMDSDEAIKRLTGGSKNV